MNLSAFPAKVIRPDSCASCSAMHRASPQIMECRLNPPSVTPLIGPDARGNPALLGNVTIFPAVNASMCCKQYKRSVIVADQLSAMATEGAA